MFFWLDFFCRVHEQVRNAETRDGASFTALFGPALCLGIISRRRVHYEAITYEKDRNAGFLSPFGYSAVTIGAAADAVCSMEVLVFTVFCIGDICIVIYLVWFYDMYLSRMLVCDELWFFIERTNLNFVFVCVGILISFIYLLQWYWLLGLKSIASYNGTYSIQIWRWKGHLIQVRNWNIICTIW